MAFLDEFSQAERNFKTPEMFEAQVAGKATARGRFLLELDMFSRRMDLAEKEQKEALAFKREALEQEGKFEQGRLDLAKESLGESSEQWRAELAALRGFKSGEQQLQRQQLGLQRELGFGQIEVSQYEAETKRGALELEEEGADFARPFYEKYFDERFGEDIQAFESFA